MGIFRSTDPTTWDDVDGIIVNESAPAPNVAGIAANIAILVGQCERGPGELTEVGSIGQFHEFFGKSNYGCNSALKNKKFGRLKILRVVASDALTAELTFQDDTENPKDLIRFKAKQGKGQYGNRLQIKIESGSSTGKKYIIKDSSENTVFQQEVYDNVLLAHVNEKKTFAGSQLIEAVVLNSSSEPKETDGFALLDGGSDGVVTDLDYAKAIDKAGVEQAGNFLFLDEHNSARNQYLKIHAAETQDKMVLICGEEEQSLSAAMADAANYRDVDGRIIYLFPWIQTSIDGVVRYTNPASWAASILSQTAPNVDPAFVATTNFTQGITGLKKYLTRSDYMQLKEAGVAAFEHDHEIGFKLKSAVVTQVSDQSKVTIVRRRMADYLTNSVGRFLKNYQNAVNSAANRALVKGSILSFIQSLEKDGILPKDSEIKDGVAKLVDVESLNTDSSIAQGIFKILWKQRIYSSMRYIVLQAEIGQGVVVKEG